MAGAGLLFLVAVGALGQGSFAYTTKDATHDWRYQTTTYYPDTTRDWRYMTSRWYQDTTRDWRYQTTTYYPDTTRDWRYMTSRWYPDTTRDWRYQDSTYDQGTPPPCGQSSYSSSGVIESPNYPYFYYNNQRCEYHIRTSSVIQLRIDDIELELHSDKLEIKYTDLWGQRQHVILSGTDRGTVMRGRDFEITFYTDSSVTKKGYQLSWKPDTSYYGGSTDRYNMNTDYTTGGYWGTTQGYSHCGGDFSATYVVLESPNYPQPYPSNAYCYYEVSSPVELEMKVEGINLEPNYDTLRITKDYDDWDNVTLTGYNTTDGFTWRGKHFSVLFRSDGSNQYPDGFRIVFQPAFPNFSNNPSTSGYYGGSTDYWRTSPGYYEGSTEPPASCGGTYRAREGVIESPNYPDRYPNNADCWYYIYPGTDVTLKLEGYDLESGYDYLSMVNNYGYTVWNISGNSPYTLYHDGRYFRVHFESDGSEMKHGFRLAWGPASDSTTPPSWWGYTTGGWWTTRSWWTTSHWWPYTSDPSDRIEVNCNAKDMSVAVPLDVIRQVFQGVSPYELTLNNPNCRGQVYSDVVIFRSSILGCGMTREETMYEVVYQNRILRPFRTPTTRSYNYNYYGTTENSGGAAITRFDSPDIKIECSLDNYATAVGFYRPQNHEIIARGHGNLSVYMDFYRDYNYHYKITSYPINLALNQDVFVDLRLDAADPDLRISASYCFATPSHDSYTYYNNRHNLISNGCPVDPAVAMEYSPNQHVHFRFRTFEFLKDKDHVYIFCQVNICNNTDYYRRCDHNCYGRHRRDTADVAEDEEHDLRIFQGPLKLRTERSAEQENKQVSAVSGSIPAVVIAVAAVAMVVASVVMVITSRRRNRSVATGEDRVI